MSRIEKDSRGTAPQPERAPTHRHLIAAETSPNDEVQLVIKSGWWFRVFHSWLESGWWASFSPAARAVIIVMAKFANQAEGGTAWPHIRTVCRYAGLMNAEGRPDTSSAYRAIAELEEATVLVKTTRGYRGKRQAAWIVQEATKTPRRFPKGISYGWDIPNGEIIPSAGKSREKSHGRESQLYRNRSNSESEIEVEQAAARGREEEQKPDRTLPTLAEIDAKLNALSPEELTEAQEMAIAMAEEPLKPFFRKANPRKHPILRARMAALIP